MEIDVEVMAQVGKAVGRYRKLIEQGHVDLLVMRAKEDDQMAMQDGPSFSR